MALLHVCHLALPAVLKTARPSVSLPPACRRAAGRSPAAAGLIKGCSAWDKRSIPQYAKLADAVHEYGARMLAQLAGWGVHDKGAMVMDEWHPLWAASRVASVLHHETPMVVGQVEIGRASCREKCRSRWSPYH